MSRQRRLSRVESLESRQLMAADLGAADVAPTEAGYNGEWFIADSFSFGVEREMKESGEKGGTADINIGVGELQECTISKSMDAASIDLAHTEAGDSGEPMCYLKYKLDRCFVKSWSTSGDADDRPTEEVAMSTALAQFAINGNSPGTAEIDFVEVAGSGDADDRPTEEVAFYYNKIAFQYAATKDGEIFENEESR